MKITNLGVFSNPNNRKSFMEKLKIFPIQKIGIDPANLKAARNMIKKAGGYSQEYGTQWIILVPPMKKLTREKAWEHFNQIKNLVNRAEKEWGLIVHSIDVGIELRIVAEYTTVEEYLVYWDIACETFKDKSFRKLIAPGFFINSNREVREAKKFLRKCRCRPDIFGIHIYPNRDGNKNRTFEHQKNMLNKILAITKLPIALTETGQHSKERYRWWDFLKRNPLGGVQYQADVIMRWVRYLIPIKQVIIGILYTHSDSIFDKESNEAHFGVFYEPPTFKRKPVYHRLAQLFKG